jgi:hypothetical protein
MGNCRAISPCQQGYRHKITAWERFGEFAKEHGDKTQRQMTTLWDKIVL